MLVRVVAVHGSSSARCCAPRPVSARWPGAQVVLEMVELREVDTARAMLRQTAVFTRMKQAEPDRFLRLEHLCGRTYFDIRRAHACQDVHPCEARNLLLGGCSVAAPARSARGPWLAALHGVSTGRTKWNKQVCGSHCKP